jgi:acetyltransferase-like isoleucine patch superfamily enzyme
MKGARIGADCNLGEHVFVESGVVIGNDVTVKNGISIWDKVTIEDGVFLGPHMVFSNHLKPRAFRKGGRDAWSPVTVRKGATIGAGAVILPGIEIGSYAFVAAGAVVTRSVPDYGFVAGNPASLKGYFCQCLETRFSLTSTPDVKCKDCGVVFQDIVRKN